MAACPSSGVEVHHRIPRCLLRMRDRADAHPEPLSGGLQAWLDYECEALRYGVDPDVRRDELAALIETSTVELSASEHRAIHSADFAEWGRLGGLTMARRYGTAWFSLLARRRWERVTAETLAEVFGALSGGAGGRS
jgi:hypothetical protein